MVIVNKDSPQRDTDFKIKFAYTEDVYQEIVNSESFDFTTCFSGVGGFVGIFLGFSMREIPEMLINIPGLLGLLQYMKKLCVGRNVAVMPRNS